VIEPTKIHFDSKPLQQLRFAEHAQLRLLTNPDPESHMRAILRERPRFVHCFFAWHEETIVGWSMARWFAPFEASPRNAHISVFVDPLWRRHGIGRALLGQAVAFATSHRLTPWVYAGARHQLQFFRACEHSTHIISTPFPLR
jgi:GNAT superfamily N-acetyltransferase